MDSFGLRQEQSELLKSVESLKHKLEIGEARVKKLHDEEMQYLKEIPEYKKQSSDSRNIHVELLGKTISLMATLSIEQKKLDKIIELTTQESNNLNNIIETQKKIIQETKEMNEKIKQDHMQLKQRELAVSDREKSCDLREICNKNRDSELDNREIQLNNRNSQQNDMSILLQANIDNHNRNVNEHIKKVDIFIQTKELHLQDEQILKDKLQKADRLIKNNSDLKSQLLLQSDKLSKEITITQSKQVSLDRSIADLKNQENAIKIKELKVNKLIHDNGLEKELKSLQESLK